MLPKVAFFDALSNGYWYTRYFFTSFFSKSNFMIFRQFSAFSGFSLNGNPILTSDLDSSSNFISIIVVRIFFLFFFHFCIIEKTQDAKMTKNPCLRKQGQIPLRKTNFWHFCILCLPIIPKWKKNKKNIRTTIIDVKFDEESKSEVRIGLLCKEKRENAENCRKIMELLVEKNDVKKYLVHQ